MIFSFLQFNESVGNTPIYDQEGYRSDMSRSFIDKLFFIDKLDSDVIVDFGCADGFILSKIKMLKPDIKIVGYDLDKQMLQKANDRLNDANCFFTDNWSEVLKTINGFNKPMLLLSSVIHEIYSYNHPREVSKFWKDQVFSGAFSYVCIRDMIPTDKISSIKNFQNDVQKVRDVSDPVYLNSFEQHWGDISSDYRTFIHYLLKYRYKDNWKRELLENYVPISLQTLKSKIPQNYKITFQENYTYSYFAQTIRDDFDIEIKGPTHTKMIIKRI